MTTTARMTAEDLRSAMSQCCGSCEFYRHWTRRLRYTEGMKLLAEQGGGAGAPTG